MFDIETVPEEDRERVAALIPDPRIAKAYVHRTVGSKTDFELFAWAMEELENVMLAGPTGSSKTTAFRAFAAAHGLPFCVVECNGAMDPGTVLGRTTLDVDGKIKWIDGDFSLVVRYGGVLLIDEINMAHPRITAAFHQLLAVTRRMSIPEAGETIVAGRGGTGAPQPLLIGAAMNPDYRGSVQLNYALANRYPMPIEWGYDRSVEEQLVRSARLLDLAENVRSLGEIRTPMSTNALIEFERHALGLDIDLAQMFLINRFAPEERAPIARALEANIDAIEAELNGQAS